MQVESGSVAIKPCVMFGDTRVPFAVIVEPKDIKNSNRELLPAEEREEFLDMLMATGMAPLFDKICEWWQQEKQSDKYKNRMENYQSWQNDKLKKE